MLVTYPWMPKELNPNTRVHHHVYNKYFQQYKTAVWALTKEANLPKYENGKVWLSLTFYSPDRRRRDLDNCLSSFKAGLDGISLAIGVDDSKFALSLDMADEIGGYVKVYFYKQKEQI